MSISVKVVRIPGRVVEVELEAGATAGDALEAAETQVESGEKLSVNGSDANEGRVLNDGDKVILAKGAKGNA